jgi:2'-5' RNA ligase
MRTFIAIELDRGIRQQLIKLLRSFPQADGVRWVSDNQLHLTLKFLGDVPDAKIPNICDIAAEACAEVAPFPIRIAGLGVFPKPANPRVLWCGVEDQTQSCRRWIELADPLLTELNYKPETRAYTPHITLGRSKSTPGARVLREMLDNAEPPDTQPMQVERVVVFESKLLPTGAVYRPIAKVALGG